MAQRYIIYIKDTPLFIIQPDGLPKDTIIFTVNEDNITFEIEKILRGDSPKAIVLETESPERALKNLTRKFRYIEAAGGLVKNKNDEYLFIYRLNKWDLPKGKLEKNESIVECAIREVEEECGVTISSVGQELPSTYHMYKLKDEVVLKRTYWFSMNYDGNQQLVPQTEEDIMEVVWVSNDNFDMVKSNTYPAIKDLLTNLG
ncbi:NUDIX domain-containing protein [Solitalea sp. MAHUQ-68]|uniref:NUDIX domain-containing protein n=1 Tax=Solitalea agri TaxID=2953739 RepID=A0A9X2F3M8_9SPHI|nr:NUDIX domain-containing protein [Solitalea agri]MCO4294152.1 NUDIX domain-containing protein [Solitalea agri]